MNIYTLETRAAVTKSVTVTLAPPKTHFRCEKTAPPPPSGLPQGPCHEPLMVWRGRRFLLSEVRVRTCTSDPRVRSLFSGAEPDKIEGYTFVEFKNPHLIQDRLYHTAFIHVATLPPSATSS